MDSILFFIQAKPSISNSKLYDSASVKKRKKMFQFGERFDPPQWEQRTQGSNILCVKSNLALIGNESITNTAALFYCFTPVWLNGMKSQFLMVAHDYQKRNPAPPPLYFTRSAHFTARYPLLPRLLFLYTCLSPLSFIRASLHQPHILSV